MALLTRDLTTAFLDYRKQESNKKLRFKSNDYAFATSDRVSGSESLLKDPYRDESQTFIEMTYELPPVWVDKLEEAQDQISKIKEKMSQLQKAQQKRLLRVFDSNDAPDLGVQRLTSAIPELFRSCEATVKSLNDSTMTLGDDTHATLLLKKNAQRNIATQLQQLSQSFRKQQKSYMNEVDKRVSPPEVSYSSIRSTDDGSDALLSDTLTIKDNVDQDIGMRNEEISKILQSLGELHSIFKEAATLVIEQGTVIDCIDYNMEQVVHTTSQANTQLRKAEHHQRSSLSTTCLIVLIVVNAILVSCKNQDGFCTI